MTDGQIEQPSRARAIPSGIEDSSVHKRTTPPNQQRDISEDNFHIPPIGTRSKRLLDRSNKNSSQEYFDDYDPIDEVVEYYQVVNPNDLVVVYGFKYIIYDHDRFPHRRIGRAISLFKKVNRVYFNGVQLHRLGYNGDLRTGIEFKIPDGKLLIIYERHCFIPYISISVNRRKLVNSPSNPNIRAQQTGEIVSMFGYAFIGSAIILDIFSIIHTGKLDISWQLSLILCAGLLYLLIGYGIKSMRKAAAAFACILHPALYLTITHMIIKSIPELFNSKPATDFSSIYVTFQMLLLIPITFIFGYYYLFIINAFNAIKEDSNNRNNQ